jgi:hypothetical protein
VASSTIQGHPGIIELVPDQAKISSFVVKFGEGFREEIVLAAEVLAVAVRAGMDHLYPSMQAGGSLNLDGNILVTLQAEGILGGFKGAVAKAAFLLKFGVGLVAARQILAAGLRAKRTGAKSQAAGNPNAQAEDD